MATVLPRQGSEVLLLSTVFIFPDLYKAIKDSTKPHIVADGNYEVGPIPTEPTKPDDDPIRLLSYLKFEDASGIPCESLGIVQVAKSTDSTDAPIPRPFYHDDMNLSVVSTRAGLEEEKLELVDANIPPQPAEEFLVNIEHWRCGIVGEFRPAIGGFLVAVISKNAADIKFFATKEELVEQVKHNRTTGPDWQFTIADVTINQKPSSTPYPIAMFYYAEKLSRDTCYYIMPDPDKKCVKLIEARYGDESTIMRHRQWSNNYPTSTS